MLPYFKKYTILICALSVGITVVVSTIYPLFTGQIMAASLEGLMLLFIIFFGSMVIFGRIFSSKAQDEADRMVALYNDDCDPKAFLSSAKSVASSIVFPCKESGAWFISYYGQALLDSGHGDEAKKILEGLEISIDQARSTSQRASIIADTVALAEKIEGDEAALHLIDEGLSSLENVTNGNEAETKNFLEGQKKILETQLTDDPTAIEALDASIANNDGYPKRIRVEYAFKTANEAYKLGNTADERRYLQFVSDHGGHLILVDKAKTRLSDLR